MSNVCCPTELKPVVSNYERKAQNYYVAGLDDESRSKACAIILIPDIYSFHPNAMQLADILAAEGYTVIIPNYFGESAGWPMETPIDPSKPEWTAFYTKYVSQFDSHVTKTESAAKFLKALGAQKLGAIGMCWGSKVALMAAEKNKGLFSTLVLPHPSFFSSEMGRGVTAATYLLPSKEENDEIMKHVFSNLQAENPKSEHTRFDDLHHGFLGARGYFPGSQSQMPEDYMKRTEEALNAAIGYFKQNLV